MVFVILSADGDGPRLSAPPLLAATEDDPLYLSDALGRMRDQSARCEWGANCVIIIDYKDASRQTTPLARREGENMQPSALTNVNLKRLNQEGSITQVSPKKAKTTKLNSVPAPESTFM